MCEQTMNKLNYMNNTKEEKFLKLLKSGNYREFLNSSSKELKSGRGTAALFKMRGIALSKLGEHSKALDNFRKMGKNCWT